MHTLCCSRPLLLAYRLSTPVKLMPNAAPEPLPEAGARHERTLEAVGCRRLIMIAASPSTDPSGMLRWGKRHSRTSRRPQGDATRNRTHVPAASTCMPGPCPSVSCPRTGSVCGTAIGRLVQRGGARAWRRLVPTSSWRSPVLSPAPGAPPWARGRGCPAFWGTRSRGTRSTGARPQTIPWMRQPWRSLCAAGCAPPRPAPPAARRAPRALWRRRRPLVRQRAALLAHGHHTPRPDTRPASGKQSAYTANRAGVAERVPAPAVPKSSAVALALLDDDAPRLPALALHRGHPATHHAAHTV